MLRVPVMAEARVLVGVGVEVEAAVVAAMVQPEPEQTHIVPSETLIHTAVRSMLHMANLVLPLQTRVPGSQPRGQSPAPAG